MKACVEGLQNQCKMLPRSLMEPISQEQGTQGDEKKQQLAKEYKEKVRFSENSFQRAGSATTEKPEF